MKGKQHVQEMVMILYFSIVTRGTIIIFGHKFLTMAQEAYVIAQPGSLLHLSHETIFRANSKNSHVLVATSDTTKNL